MNHKNPRPFLALALMLTMMVGLCAGCSEAPAKAETPSYPEEMRAFEDSDLGIRFTIPNSWYAGMSDRGNIGLMLLDGRDYGFSVQFLPSEALAELEALYKQFSAVEAGKEIPQALYDQQAAILAKTLWICAIDATKGAADTNLVFEQLPDKKTLGEADGTVYTLYFNANMDVTALPEVDQAEYRTLVDAIAEFEGTLELTGIHTIGDMAGEIVFESETLTGEPMSSAIFADYKLTVVNIWATWCGPCVNEMPGLQKLFETLPEGVNLIGICTDGADDPEAAALTVEKTGVKYPNVVVNAAMDGGFLQYVTAYPTTLFIDSHGNIVGTPAVGAPGGDVAAHYLEMIEERLAALAK